MKNIRHKFELKSDPEDLVGEDGEALPKE